MKYLIIVVSLITTSFCYGQDYNKSDSLIRLAKSFYQEGNYEKSAAYYGKGFNLLGGLAYDVDRYNAACAYALAGDSSNAFMHLFSLANGGGKYKQVSHLKNDPDLKSLHISNRWEVLLDIVANNKYNAEKNLDQELIAILDTVISEDQKYRMQINGIKESFGWESPEMKNHLNAMKERDSINLQIVRKIIDEKGWLGPDIVGYDGNSALFLVIQHADATVQSKYLPLLREAVEQGNAYASDLALLEDRVAVASGKKQIYGSQIGYDDESEIYFVEPIEYPECVDERRAEVGLRPIAEYVKSWGIIWDIEKHKLISIKN